MSHELLNNLWGNSLFKASTAERMSQRMRGNFRHLDTVNPVVFLNDMLPSPLIKDIVG